MFHTIVFSGGANYAAAFVGCIRYLEHIGLRHAARRLVGSSAGALIALLTALGLSSDEMRAWSMELAEVHLMNKISLDSALDLYETCGIDSGEHLLNAVKATLAKYGFADERDPTFKDLAQKTGNDLFVCVLNLSSQQFEYLSVDTTPLMSVALAVRMSMSLPVMFTPVHYNGNVYVDPVLGRNFPYDFPGRTPQTDSGVLGLYVSGTRTKTLKNPHCAFQGFILALMAVVVDQSNNHADKHAFRMVNVEIADCAAKFDVATMAFTWTPDIISHLAKSGYAEAKRVLQDYANPA
ncbi:hypothetical protein TSOC_012998 [Tetrabaena socialis]|uniref:Patatin n=1 Tax=Tetrabaena socialis TaxID=47790 RepID=A0A2J7ZLI6_9CHLO|nr:hypothetical protein TSOC_012998 [Tetrabaena socialis]|eukprot:PNH01128.1 hypothetical protein TSOC_012998 [Tetrabaena socialis]